MYRQIAFGLLFFLMACGQPSPSGENNSSPAVGTGLYDRSLALQSLDYLSSDRLEGRRSGSEGAALARGHIIDRLEALDVAPWQGGYQQSFTYSLKTRDGAEIERTGINIAAIIPGSAERTRGGGQPRQIVMSAHYDHLGVRDGQIYNGADDNASGVVGLLALAESFRKKPPQNDIILVFFDAEELGLRGARAFVDEHLVAANVALNVNLDMISRSDKKELYAAGAFHTPALRPFIERVAKVSPIKLVPGHDDPALKNDDWTLQSDHGPFHRAGIPFLYFGVEDHPHYHAPIDDFETIDSDFFLNAVSTIVHAAHALDAALADGSLTL